MSSAAGAATLQYVVATAFVLVVFVGLTNLVVDLYARWAVRAAVDEAVRAGARVDASAAQCCGRVPTTCSTDLLGGRLRAGVDVSCAERVDVVTATADVRLPGWLLLPDWSFTVTGTAVKERMP